MTNTPGIVEPPTATDLLGLVAAFLRQDVVPAIADAKLRYRVRAAESLLNIARRELEHVPRLVRDDDGYLVTEKLIEHSGSLERLNDRLSTGELDIASPAVLSLLEEYVIEKLRIAAPDSVPGNMTMSTPKNPGR